MVKIVVGADLVSHTHTLHVIDLGSGELVGVLDRALSHLLVTDGIVDRVVDGRLVVSFHKVLVTLVCVLVTTCPSKKQN